MIDNLMPYSLFSRKIKYRRKLGKLNWQIKRRKKLALPDGLLSIMSSFKFDREGS
jgi:hypothetical protein